MDFVDFWVSGQIDCRVARLRELSVGIPATQNSYCKDLAVGLPTAKMPHLGTFLLGPSQPSILGRLKAFVCCQAKAA